MARAPLWSPGLSALVVLLAGCSGGKQVVATPTPAVPSAQAATNPTPLRPFRAVGNEPGWHLTIDEKGLVLVTDYGQTTLTAPAPQPQMAGTGTRYQARASGRTVVVTVQRLTCADTMSGMPWPATVEVTVDGKRYAGCGGEPAELLLGAEWVVEDLSGRGIIDRSRLTLNFGADGRLAGRASCNDYSGQYTLTGEGLSVSQTISTMKACSPALMNQEVEFLAILAKAGRFEISETGALVLRTDDQRSITARRP